MQGRRPVGLTTVTYEISVTSLRSFCVKLGHFTSEWKESGRWTLIVVYVRVPHAHGQHFGGAVLPFVHPFQGVQALTQVNKDEG